ncbi:MAG: TonB-dependent receptor [Elusimicrobia bacterium]|nr:TonB-dependent receptor [Elusimicrobiota bacterium]
MRILMALTAFGALLSPAQAAEVGRVDEIVVQDTEETRAMQERRESTTAKTIVTRREMAELGGQTAADVLRRLPRLFFSGPPSINKDIRMNGLDKEFQNVLINGSRPPGGGEKREFSLDRIPVEQIERMEVFKNPNASHDADAVAGFVNIVLKRPPPKRTISVSGQGSVNDRADRLGDKFTATVGDQFGPVGAQVGGTRSDEFRGKDKAVSDTAKNERESESELKRFLTVSGLLNLEWRIGESDRVSLRPLISNQDESTDKDRLVKNLATGANKSRNRESEVKEASLQSYGADWEHKFSGGAILKLEGSWAMNEENKEKKTAQFTGAALAFSKNVFEDERKQDKERVAAAEFKLPWTGPRQNENLLSTGLKWRDKDRRVTKTNWEVNPAGVRADKTVPDDSYRVDETINAAFVMNEASLTDKLVLTPGVRVEFTDGGYQSGGGRSATGRFVDWNPSAHALYRIRDGLQARASVARTISRPSFRDKVPTRSVKPDKVEEGNPDLGAARSINAEAGLEKYFGKTGFLGAGGFYKRIVTTQVLRGSCA